MRLESIRAMRGPNIWSRRMVVEAKIAVDAEPSAQAVEALAAELAAALPELERAALDNPEGSPLARLFARTALALQQGAGCAVSFGIARATEQPGLSTVVVEYGREEVGRRALERAAVVLGGLGGVDPRPDVDAEIRALRSLDEQVRLGPTTGAIVRAAGAQGIPSRRLNEGSLVQLGWGVKQRRILASETDRTGAVAEAIAQDKELTKALLHAVGVPVPKGRPVRDAADAWAAARELGVPVVVKPRGGNQGRGVAVNLTTEAQVIEAFDAARREGSEILVERFIAGDDHRLLVIGGKLAAAARREPPQVIGDGVRTVRELVDEVNADPRRGEDHATCLSKIPLDAIAVAVLAEQGLTTDSVPESRRRVLLRRNGNLSTGGTATDVTDEVHPQVVERAAEAAQVVGLDVCGVDVVCSDVSRPLEEQGGAVVEVNAAPGFRMHLEPSTGKPRAVGEAVIASMFAPGDDGRIPVVAVSGTNGKTTVVRLTTHLLRTAGMCVGMTCTEGVFVDDTRLDHGDCSGPRSARSVLSHPRVEAAVLETARGGVLREGLGFDRCAVAVVTNVGSGDHLGQNGIFTIERLAKVKQVIVENVAATGTAVLNAADPLSVAMEPSCPGSVVFFACDPANPVLAARRAQGGRCLFVEGDAIVASEATRQERVAELAAVPLTLGGISRFQVENAMAAVGAAWSLGLPWETIRRGLATFASDVRRTPGRFNLMSYRGAQLVVDYGHNPHALLALLETLQRMPASKRLAMITAAGDRRDVDIIDQGRILGAAFDDVVLYEDQCNRGRTEGEIIGLLRRGVRDGLRARAVVEVRGEFSAIDTALARLGPGDLGLLLIDQVEPSLEYLARVLAAEAVSREDEAPAEPKLRASA